ncbi:class I SAM-dependent methyltransferase [Fodinicurvata fenggangensis]|uniref:class I SAM-dependent methyltransferase n=1 Tax=Fodinicurvata fenggangensis TaxID=1121830 RepID=UPI0004787612|nr:class I SAM-dependent methyltransferase [Fodinicurvata fenggangensis]
MKTPAVPFSHLAQLDLGLTSQDLRELFLPFARPVPCDASEWKRDLFRRKRRILKRLLRQHLTGGRSQGRTSDAVLEEYSKAWSGLDYAVYDPEGGGTKPIPWHLGKECFLASDVGATRVRQQLLVRVIERLRPRRVLEVGCGNGINLLLAAGRFPEVSFTGLELTEVGVAAAQGFQQQHDELPSALQAFAPEPLEDKQAFRRIEFVQGNAAAMPFETGQFDLVYSMLALEQMEAIRLQALGEIARVANGAYFGVEPFREANASGWRRLYVRQRGYFRGSFADLAASGLKSRWATTEFPQEVFLGACAVLADAAPPRAA